LNHVLKEQKPLLNTRDSTICFYPNTYTADKHVTIFYRKTGVLIVVYGFKVLAITKGDGGRYLERS